MDICPLRLNSAASPALSKLACAVGVLLEDSDHGILGASETLSGTSLC